MTIITTPLFGYSGGETKISTSEDEALMAQLQKSFCCLTWSALVHQGQSNAAILAAERRETLTSSNSHHVQPQDTAGGQKGP